MTSRDLFLRRRGLNAVILPLTAKARNANDKALLGGGAAMLLETIGARVSTDRGVGNRGPRTEA
jgi:hypothetical protein